MNSVLMCVKAKQTVCCVKTLDSVRIFLEKYNFSVTLDEDSEEFFLNILEHQFEEVTLIG